MKVTFEKSEDIAENIKTFWFKPEKDVRYIAGQFIELRIPHDNKDKRGDKRWFTLSSSPEDTMLSITTKFAAENGSSFKQALKTLEPGTQLDMASPMGDFILPKDPTVPLVFVAGGIGSTPFHSIVKHLQDTGEARNITIIYAARAENEIAFKDTFNKLGASFYSLVGQPLDAEAIKKLGRISDDHLIYLSGPEPMIEAIAKDLKNGGVNKKKIHTDFFPGYTQL